MSARQQAPTDQTRVVVVYDDTPLYVAFTCLDARPELIRASQITRDAPPGLDDRVTVELDPHHNHRSVSRFTVTARGTQSDAMAGGRGRQRAWQGEWRAAARRTPVGWTAEMAIPFALLEFDPDADTFGINFSRYQNRTREWSEWADLTPQRLPGGGRPPDRPAAADRRRRRGSLAVMQYLASNPRERGRGDAPAEIEHRRRRALPVGPRADVDGLGASRLQRHRRRRARHRLQLHREVRRATAGRSSRKAARSSATASSSTAAASRTSTSAPRRSAASTTTRWACWPPPTPATGRADYVGRVVREVGPAFNLSATVAGTRRDAVDNNAVQLQAGGTGRTRTCASTANIARTSRPAPRGRRHAAARRDCLPARALVLRRLGRSHRPRLLRRQRVPRRRPDRHDRPRRLRRLHARVRPACGCDAPTRRCRIRCATRPSGLRQRETTIVLRRRRDRRQHPAERRHDRRRLPAARRRRRASGWRRSTTIARI